jgi:hypothetical protein
VQVADFVGCDFEETLKMRVVKTYPVSGIVLLW